MLRKNKKKILNKIIIKTDIKLLISIYITMLIQTVVLMIQPLVMMKLIDSSIEKQMSVKNVLGWGVLYLGIIVVQVFLFYIYNILNEKWRLKFEIKLRKNIIESVIYDSDNLISSGDFDALLKKDVSELEMFLRYSMIEFPCNVIKGIILIVVIFVVDWKLSLILVIMNILTLVIQKKVNERIFKNSEVMREVYGEYYDSLTEISTSGIFANEINAGGYLINKFEKKFKQLSGYIYKGEKLNQVDRGMVDLTGGITQVLLLVSGGIMVFYQIMSIGILVSFLQYSGQLLGILEAIVQYPTMVSNSKVIYEKITMFIREDSVVSSSSALQPIVVNSICLDNVSFKYTESTNILENASVKFLSGKVNVILGSSGEGKTTLLKILLCKQKVDRGKILLDGTDNSFFSQQNINQFVGYLPQNDIVFRDTIKENVLLCRDITDDKLEEIILLCEIKDEINRMDKGIDTLIEKENINLSGGQIKRIMLARLFVEDKPIYLLDEPTSSLDSVTAKKIMRLLRKIAQNHLIVMITHDKSLLSEEDYVFKIDNKQIKPA